MDLLPRVLDLALLGPWFQDSPGAAPAAPTGNFPWIPMLAIGVLFYFLLIAPERKRKQAREALLGGLGKNDKVMTTGGIFGTVSKVDEQTVTLRVDEGVHLRVAKGSIQGVVGDDGALPE